MATYQGRAWETVLYLELLGVPVAAVAYDAITVEYRKSGETAFTTRTLTTGDWVNLGDGYYVLKWPAAVLDLQGKFLYKATGVGFDNFLYDEFDVDPVPYPLTVGWLRRAAATLRAIEAQPLSDQGAG